MCEGLSRISGPIPPHPMFLRDNSFSSVPSVDRNNPLCEGPSKLIGPFMHDLKSDEEKALQSSIDYEVNPRVRESGRANFNSQKNSDRVALLLQLQGRAINPATFKIREPPKNHIAANTSKIKQYMRKAKEKEHQKELEKAEKAPPVKALWKSEKYKDVQSKLKELLIVTKIFRVFIFFQFNLIFISLFLIFKSQPMAPRDTKRDFLRAHSRTGSRPQSARPVSQASQTNTAEFKKKYGSKDDIDFVKHNQKVATTVQLKRAPSIEMLKQVQSKLDNDLNKYNEKIKGKIPK